MVGANRAVRVSVVIPARNAAGTIGTTLNALAHGTEAPDEVLVVDGRSRDATVAIATAAGARTVSNEQIHAAAARQLGLTEARHPVVAYTDADCVPAADWVACVRRAFEETPGLDGLGGVVKLAPPRNEIQRYSASVFEAIMRFPTVPTRLERKQMSGSFAGANCAYLASTLRDAGGFRAEFSNHAEDIDACWRLVERRACLLFDPRVVVQHLGYAETVGALMRTNFRYGFASTKLAKYHIGSQVDLGLYRVWVGSALRTILAGGTDRTSSLRTVQVGTFIFGKLVSSVVYRTVNL